MTNHDTALQLWLLTDCPLSVLTELQHSQRWAVLAGTHRPYELAGLFPTPEAAAHSYKCKDVLPQLMVDTNSEPATAFYDIGVISTEPSCWHIWPTTLAEARALAPAA